MEDATTTSGSVPHVEKTWSVQLEATAQPLPARNLGSFDEPASTSMRNLEPSGADRQVNGAATIASGYVVMNRPPHSPASQAHTFVPKQSSSSTLSVLNAAAASLKDKTQQVAQQQKRALFAFQQKGGLVGWLHGEMDSIDNEEECNTSTISATEQRSPTTTRTSSVIDNLSNPLIEKPIERRRSVPNIGSNSLLDNFLDKVAGVATSQPASPLFSNVPMQMQDQPRVKLRPTTTTTSSYELGKESSYHANTSSFSEARPRSATTDVPNRPMADNDLTAPALLKSRSVASLSTPTRFSLDDVLSDEWSSTVLWAHLYSSASGREHQHHQRLSFLIEATFQITPLYQKLAGVDGTSSDKENDSKKLATRLKRLHARFLAQNGSAALATSGVPVASPAASHAKKQLAVAIHTLTDQSGRENDFTQVEKAVSALLQLAREVEREFRVLGTKCYAKFADTTVYRDFVTNRSGPGNIAVLLRAARIPFYQQPNGVMSYNDLDSLALEHTEVPATVFSRAGCQVFIIAAQCDGSIKFTDISPDAESTAGKNTLLHTIEPILNPSATMHPPSSKPLAFNFTAGGGDNILYGAVMWLPVDQSDALGVNGIPAGLCIVSKLPLVNSLRHFLRCLWKGIRTKIKDNSSAIPVEPTEVASASIAMGEHFIALQRDISLDDGRLPVIDFRIDDLFDCLSLTHVLRLFAFVLLERKIVLVASSYTVLFSVSEALRTLIHPLVWSHVYVPVLPLALKDCLQCPTPFIFGLHDSYVRRSEIPRPSNDLVVVNLDRDSLTGGGDVYLPPVRHSMMREELFRLCKPHLATRDSVDNFDGDNYSLSAFPAHAVCRVFHNHLREILASLEPCVNRFEFNGQFVSVVDNVNTSQWPADTARFCSTLLHTQAESTYLASPQSDERAKANSIFV